MNVSGFNFTENELCDLLNGLKFQQNKEVPSQKRDRDNEVLFDGKRRKIDGPDFNEVGKRKVRAFFDPENFNNHKRYKVVGPDFVEQTEKLTNKRKRVDSVDANSLSKEIMQPACCSVAPQKPNKTVFYTLAERIESLKFFR